MAVAAALGLIGGVLALAAGRNGGGSSLKTGSVVGMRPVGNAKEAANAHLIQYDTPPTRLSIDLAPKEARHQLLLFDDPSRVRSFQAIPGSAELVKGDDSQDLRNTYETTGADLPPYFRRYRYFGIVRVSGTARTLTLFGRTDRLGQPK